MTPQQTVQFGDISGQSNGWAGRFIAIALIILLIRVVSLWFNNADLFFDEAQYWVWAKEPAFGYFSKPPLLAWVIAGFTSVCGDSEFCVRLPSAVFHTVTAGILYLTAANLFDARTGFATGITWLLLPAVSLSSTLISTDVPLLLCWSIALYAFIRLRDGAGWKWVVLLGIAFGLGLNAKYAMAYFLLCALIYAVFSATGRRTILSIPFWTAIVGGFVLLVPNLLWNRANDFITASHTGDNIGWGGGFPHLDRLAEFFGSQFGVVGPVIFTVYLLSLYRFWRDGISDTQKMLVSFSLPILLLICFQAVMSRAYANWAATAFPALVILVSHLMVSIVPSVWSRVSNGIHVAVFAILAILTAFAAPGQLPLPEKQNPFQRMWGGSELGEIVSAELAKGSYSHILSDSRKRSSTLIYYLRDESVRVLAWRKGDHPKDHFELTRAVQEQPVGSLKQAVFLYPTTATRVPQEIRDTFDKVTELGTWPRYETSDKTFTLFRLENYRR